MVRYRVNPRLYLCISREAVNIGITAGEESVEAIIAEGAFMGSLFYASIREMDEQDVQIFCCRKKRVAL